MGAVFQSVKLVGFAALSIGLAGCRSRPDPIEEPLGTSEQALSSTATRTLGFESLQDWGPHWSSPTLQLNALHTEGQSSLSVKGGGWMAVTSRQLTKQDLNDPVPSVVGVDVRVPPSPLNPNWFGTVEFFVDVPSAGLWNQPLGSVDLSSSGFVPGQFRRAQVSVPASVQSVLNAQFIDLRFRIAVNSTSGEPGAYLLDRFTYGPGVCTPQPDGNPCTTDTCVNGQPAWTPLPQGTACDTNADVCDGTGTCNASASCVLGAPPVVDDGNLCTTDTCNPVSGVSHTPKAAGTSCSDGNACNGQEVCNASATCLPAVPPVLDDGNPCTADSCNPATGVIHTPVPTGTSCADSTVCNGSETCNSSGACTAGTPLEVPPNTVCTTYSCDPTAGVAATQKPAGASCSNETVCDGQEACDGAGTCQAGTPVVIPPSTACASYSCDPVAGIVTTPAPNGTGCADSTVCNGAEKCSEGECLAGTPLEIPASTACTSFSCDPAAGIIQQNQPAGASCSNETMCDGAETCDGTGTCTSGTPVEIPANTACTTYSCDPIAGVVATHAAAGATCADATVCNGAETCNGSGSCTPGTPPEIPASTACTTYSCDPIAGVVATHAATGTSCADATVCNGAETCDGSGTCAAGSPLEIPPNTACTTHSCDSVAGVVTTHAAAGTSCADDTICNGAEACDEAGNCEAGTPIELPVDTVCTIYSCDPVAGLVPTQLPTGTSCANETVCDGAETCDGSGTCTGGTAPVLDDGNPCTADACDPVLGATHTPVAEGTSCSDGNACNGLELCGASGSCVPGTPLNLDSGNDCTTGVCDPETGVVTFVPVEQGVTCYLDQCATGECDGGGVCMSTGESTVDDGDPQTIDTCDPLDGPKHRRAPDLDESISTTLFASTEWLYSGPDPIQTGVAPGTIRVERVSLLRGSVRTREGLPLPDVTISVESHPEFGSTVSHADGTFLLVVNGGGTLRLKFEADDYLVVHRDVSTSWQKPAAVPEVVLIQSDPVVSHIDLEGGAPFALAQGSAQADASGARRGTLLVPAGTDATIHLADGEQVPLSEMNVRITEFTVGATGPSAMPAQLPAESKYTYAFEVNADEAVEAGAPSITFSQPLIYYVDNFLEFPAGTPVPLGAYDREAGVWKAEESGVVLTIIGEGGGAAALDVTGDGVADDSNVLATYGIENPERQKIAELYDPGDSLWRIRIHHFTQPYDCNWGGTPPDDAIGPNGGRPRARRAGSCSKSIPNASSIDCDSQVLQEKAPVAGTPYSLVYSSERSRSYDDAYTVEIPLTGPELPESLKRVDLQVTVGGVSYSSSYDAIPNRSTSFTWSGRDYAGRDMQGAQPANIRISYAYGIVYTRSTTFGAPGGGIFLLGNRQRAEVYYTAEYDVPLGSFRAKPLGLGGWTLDQHHFYDFGRRTLHLGDGSQVDSEALPQVVRKAFKNTGVGGVEVEDWVVAPDGAVFYRLNTNSNANIVYKITPNNVITPHAGNGTFDSATDGALATSVGLNAVAGLDLDNQGNLYIGEQNRHTVWRVDPEGRIWRVAGTGVSGRSGDGGTAINARLDHPSDLAVSSTGNIYIVEGGRLRVVNSVGRIHLAAGYPNWSVPNYDYQKPPDGTPAPVDPDRCVGDTTGTCEITDPHTYVTSVAVGPDDRVYVGLSDAWIFEVRDGCYYHVAGDPTQLRDAGAPAKLTGLSFSEFKVSPAGEIHWVDWWDKRIRKVGADGMVRDVVGSAAGVTYERNNTPALSISTSLYELTFGPDENLYVSLVDGELSNRSFIQKVVPQLPGDRGTTFVVAAPDGRSYFTFDASGRHLGTRDALTDTPLLTFDYDGPWLTAIKDTAGMATSIERDEQGEPLAIVAPFGQRTELMLDGQGDLAGIDGPDGYHAGATYERDGLLATYTASSGATGTMRYDSHGYLLEDRDAAGGSQTLTRTDRADGWDVRRSTQLGKTTSYQTRWSADGGQTRSVSGPAGSFETGTRTAAGTYSGTTFDGTTYSVSDKPDPRFGIAAPVKSTTLRTPSGLAASVSRVRQIAGLDVNDFSKFTSTSETATLNGRNWTTNYVKSTRVATSTTPESRRVSVTLDALGRTSRVQVQGINAVTFAYDSAGRLATLTQGNRTTAIAYAENGQGAGFAESVTDIDAAPVVFTRDSFGRPLTIDWSGSQLGVGWDHEGHLASLVAPEGQAHSYGYNGINLLTSYTPPAVDGSASGSSYIYDVDRKPVAHVGPADEVSYSYDAVGRVTGLTFPDGQIGVEYYGAAPPATGAPFRVSALRGAYGTDLLFAYDGFLGKKATFVGDVNGSVGWDYTSDLLPASQTVQAGSVSKTMLAGYDRDGALVCVSATNCNPAATDALRLFRNTDNGAITTVGLGNVNEAWTYNAYGEPARQTVTYSSAALLSLTYDTSSAPRDKAGRVKTKTEVVAGETNTYVYAYDALNRLTDVTRNGVLAEHFAYDRNGNRVEVYDPARGSRTATYDEQDRLQGLGNLAFGYDAAGSLQSCADTATGAVTLYDYDALGSLLSVLLPDGREIAYDYDALGRRIGKRVNGVLTRQWLYGEQLKPVAELDAAGTIIALFVYGSNSNVPDFVLKNDVAYRVISDPNGSPRYVVNATNSADVPFRADYSAFGEVTGSGLDWLPFGFAGGLYDVDTGLVRLGARDYDPEVGRWTAKDSFMYLGGGSNFYTYAFNDPVNFVDPTGRVPLLVVTTIGGAVIGFGSSLAVQALSGQPLNFNAALKAGAIGGLQGLLGPLGMASTLGEAAALGAVSNVALYLWATPNCDWSTAGVMRNAAWGAVGGVLGGRAPQLPTPTGALNMTAYAFPAAAAAARPTTQFLGGAVGARTILGGLAGASADLGASEAP